MRWPTISWAVLDVGVSFVLQAAGGKSSRTRCNVFPDAARIWERMGFGIRSSIRRGRLQSCAMKVLVADKFEKVGLEGLRESGFEVLFEPELKEDSLRGALERERPTGLIVRSTRVEAEHMVDGLELIVRAGAGYNTIDIEAARAKGIRVANCPGKNSAAVVELAWGLILSCDRRIPDNVFELRAGIWNKKEFSKARGLRGRTLGLIGLGHIGRGMIPVAHAFGMEVVAFSKHTSAEDAKNLRIELCSSQEDLASRSDVVSVHCSLTPETRQCIGESFFAALRPGSIFVNTSRSEVVDQSALERAIRDKWIRAGLDVFDGEPAGGEGEYDGSLRTLDGVYCTHHIGASTDQAQEAVAEETVRIFRVFRETGNVENCVNC